MANKSYQENVLHPESTLYQLLAEFFWTYWYWTTIRLCLFAYCCGIVLNSTTLVIFFNIGFTSNANITFFALAIADLYYSFHEVMTLTMADFYFSCDVCGVILGCLKNIGLYEATETTCAWITTVITLERLCCIAFPMKVKSIFTPKTTILLILGYIVPQIVVIMMATAGFVRTESLWNDPSYYNLSVSSYEPIFPLDVQRQYDAAELLHVTIPSYTGYGVNLFLYVLIIIATTLLIILFSRSNKQRNILMAKNKPEYSAKEAKVYKAVIVVCALYIFTAGPNNLLRMFLYLGFLERIIPDSGVSIMIYLHFQYLFMVFHAVNHSVNIFVYLNFNSRFRIKFMEIFCRKKHVQTH